MVSQQLTVINPEGLHMRPAAVFAQEMGKFDCDVNILYNGTKTNAKSLLSIIAAVIKCGAEIVVQCSGSDESDALKRAAYLIESGFVDV